GVLGGTLQEKSYSSIRDKPADYESTGGWLGITDKYWLVALAPDQSTAISASFEHATESAKDVYLAKYRSSAPVQLTAGGDVSFTSRLFAGAKEVHLLADYRDQLGIPLFDRAVDFGTYFYLLTKPMFYLLDFLYRIIGNFGLAILA